jgi:polyketide synthase Type III
MFINGLSTAAPLTRYSQRECWESLQGASPFEQLNSRSQAILRKVFLGENGVEYRHMALEPLTEAMNLTPDVLHARFVRHAPELAAKAAAGALADAGVDGDSMDAVIVSTCTGSVCPGLTTDVSERLGLRPDLLALDLVGQGCGAALPNLRTAEALLTAGRCQRVLSVCVEVCSAAFYLDDDPGVLISACLFGDGAGAAVLSLEPNPNRRRIKWKTAASVLRPEDRHCLHFERRNGMLRNVLGRQVPAVAGKHAARLFEEVAARTGVTRDQISAWIVHGGGRDVLLALQQRLGLTDHDLRWSAAVLREFGNLSSASVYFVMQAALADNAPGGLWWLSSFGAGFNCHGALLEVE